MSYNPKSLFNKIQSKAQANANIGGNSQSFSNPLIFKPKVGTSYSVRLLWLQPADGSDREWPMINSYIHRCWDDNAAGGQKDHKVICPTSQYIMDEVPKAFKACPICAAASDFYKKGQEGSESAKELYNKFRRTCMGYVPVYIVNGPEEDLHTIKILQYGKQFKDFFDSKIFGIKKQQRNADPADVANEVEDEAIGPEAFMYYDEETDQVVTRGYNLVIITTSKKMTIGGKEIQMPQYQLDFTRKMSAVNEIDDVDLNTKEGIKYFNSINSSILHFDRDFYLKSTPEELEEFKLNFITRSEAETIPVETPVVNAESVETEPETDPEDEIPMGDTPPKIKVSDSGSDDDIEDLLKGF